MTLLDDKLRDRRIRTATDLIPGGSRVLDVGCRDGHLFRVLGDRLGSGVGIEPELSGPVTTDRYRLVPGWFPDDLPDDIGTFDAIVMLAVLEHVPPDQQPGVVATCRGLLNPGGTVVMTIPSKEVDRILDVLERLKLVQDDSIHQHYGFDAKRDTEPLFHAGGFTTVVKRSFQFGLNNLFQFRAP